MYRVTDGVLLVVNKFVPIDFSKQTDRVVRTWKPKVSSYHKGCQKELKILKEEYFDEYINITLPKGTVMYNGIPVVATDNKPDWKYEVKTTGNSLSGDFDIIERLLSSILYTIRTGGSIR